MTETPFKCGYVAIIGRPNVGKSTLLNQILDIKLSIVTPKPQTTRKRVLGIHNDDDSQIIFLDTPGMIKPSYELHEKLMSYVEQSTDDADVVVLMVDPSKFRGDGSFKNELQFLERVSCPKVAVINKIDTLNSLEVLPLIDFLNKTGQFTDIFPLSAIKGVNVAELMTCLKAAMPIHEPLYDPELLSEHPERFFVSELIRESIFRQFSEEIPYSTEVLIEEFKEREGRKDYIRAVIFVERQSQKGILIGKDGESLKKVGAKARQKVEEFLDRGVFLELFVKVKDNWRDNPNVLKQLGY